MEPEGKLEGGEAPEAPQEPQKPQKVIQVISPLDRAEFNPLLELYIAKFGGKIDRAQAAAMLSRALTNMGVDPYKDINSAIQTANSLTTIFKAFPDTPLTAQVKDSAQATILGKMAEKVMTGGQPVDEDAMLRRMERLMYLKMLKSLGDDRGDGEESSLRKEFQEFKAAFAEDQKDKKWEDRFSKLERMIEGGPKEEGEGKVVEAIKDLKAEIAGQKEGKKEDKIVGQLKAFENRLDEIVKAPPKERTSMIQEMADEVAATTTGLKGLKDSLVELGVVKEEDVTTKAGKVNWGAVINKVIKLAEEGVKAVREKAPPRVEVQTAPIPEREAIETAPAPVQPAQPPAQEAKPEAPKPEEKPPEAPPSG